MEQNSLQKFILGIIIVGILLVMGIFISSTFQNVLETDSIATGTVYNETGAFINSTGYQLIELLNNNAYNAVLTAAYNATDGTIIGLGNLSVTSSGIVTNATVTNWNNASISYTYIYPTVETSAASNASGDLVTALSGGSAWITIIIVVGFATIVLSMLTSGLSAKREIGGPVY